ncbi:coadhesin-like [Ostrea edulis]|uniref:coadhesin-like n=1 Tax=Ostrea edulis TaxID=37623 RepID=UPI0024AF732A|nr:coadhesin-like [Ostrea edulis]
MISNALRCLAVFSLISTVTMDHMAPCSADEEGYSTSSGYPVAGMCRPCRGQSLTHWENWSGCVGSSSQSRLKTHISACGRKTVLTSETRPCPVNGTWSQWGAFNACDKTCGGGLRLRVRQCNNPPPSHGGIPCIGDSVEFVQCNTQPCLAFVTITNPPQKPTVDVVFRNTQRGTRQRLHRIQRYIQKQRDKLVE